jgi:hypothetical protein
LTFTLGIYDLFAYSIPGFFYIGVLGYVAGRADWISVNPKDVKDVPSLLVVLAVAIAAYVIGHVTWPLGRYTDRLIYRLRPAPDAVEMFLKRDPEAANIGYLRNSRFLLQARAEVANREVASRDQSSARRWVDVAKLHRSSCPGGCLRTC